MSDINDTLAERGATYGEFHEYAECAEGLRRLWIHSLNSSCVMPEATCLQAVSLIMGKFARLAHSPDHVDSWHDIAGYATLMVRDIERRQREAKQ